ncbi:unnamed protein product [Schistocephalus solidus]|uniref:PDZ domain-containing protein n=2 Tax=Schistocephalus solidus TaxID=70667 RepID=A0A0X3P5V8_SCHSO|nr:unnamed protein product [Schistocephalus solidus]
MQLKTASLTPQAAPGERKRVATTAADAVSGRLLTSWDDDSLSCACCTTPKRPRTSETPLSAPRGASPSSHAFPSLLIMGAGVRSHPLYACKRRPSIETEDGGFYATGDQATTLSSDNASSLAPVCPVPMPPAFQASVHSEGTTRAWHIARRTAQTQTSPSPPPRSSHRSRRSSGAKVLSSIKKKIGSIRRAVSADRTEKYVLNSFSSATKLSWKRRSSESTLCHPKISTDAGRVEANIGQDTVTCVLLQTFSDKSYLVQLKRTSTAIQFGFYIAKDAQGLYVSRINSPAYFARMINFIHVSDRILEVQGISAAGLDIATVSGLLRGCHIATFRVKPNKSNASTRSRSPFRHR